MKKMNDVNEQIFKNMDSENDNKKYPIKPLNLKKEKDGTISNKIKLLAKNKKAISMKYIFEDNKKKNNNMNISSKVHELVESKDNSSKPKTDNSIVKRNKMKTCIFGFESEQIFKNNLVHSVQLSKRKSHEVESSYRMENLLEKNMRIESNEKEEEFIEFYINNNRKNRSFKFSNNYISTTKYNLFTFIPKGLLFQFCRLSNVYFLFTAIIQSIPLISPLTSLTAIVPLIFVLGVSLIREAIEDLVRHNYDNLNNNEEVIVFRKNKFIKSESKTLRHGEIILIYENKSIPADMILIDSGFIEGTCYVETSSLDGEKTLKLKVANKYTNGFISNDIKVNKGVEKFVQSKKYSFNGYIKINCPNADLNYINGAVQIVFNKKGCTIDQKVTISTNEFILKGSVLKNTNWILGIVVYTGMNNKIILNSKKPRLKMSKIEKTLNYFLLIVFVFLMVCCVICSILHHFYYLRHKNFYDNFILISDTPQVESFICFFTYFLLLNTLIPISLIVSMEIIKMIQGIFISWDIFLYSKERHTFCGVKSVSIIEELGNVNFIFSDKTGTLTKNQLEFKYCIIENKFYQYTKMYGIGNKPTYYRMKNTKLKGTKNSFTNLLESNRLNNSKLGLINKLHFNNSYDKNESNNENDNNLNIYDIKNNQYYNNVASIERHFKSNNNVSKYKDKDDNLFMNKSKSKSLNHHRDNRDNNNNYEKQSDLTNGSHNSHSDSQNMSSVYSQINVHKKKKNTGLNHRTSTIIEEKNEDNNYSFSTKNDMVIIGEGYFSNPNNNNIINCLINNEEYGFSYIHEFWKALALTNECIAKEEKGEIRYTGTSPDDLELVKAAMNQGYKLIETSINAKILRIAGKDFSYEILKVLGFSSERKRMSIIIRDKKGIKIYTKGADCEITKRLSKKSLENENFRIISKGLLDFSKKGLRTLMIAYKKIREEDYNSWINRLHADEINVQNKHKMLEKLYDIIENNLVLIGGTVVEDKLQDKVPETIKELRSAGIRMWVLTGDKLDTAENIGYSCNLLSKEQKLFYLKVMPGDDENIVKENPYREMTQFFTEFHNFIENLVKKYNLDSKYNMQRSIDKKINEKHDFKSNGSSISCSGIESDDLSGKFSSKSQIIDFESFKYLRDKNFLEPFSIIIEAPILCGLFKDEDWTENFLRIAYYSNTVICCRVSPSQKSQVVQKMKNFDKKAVTLAIGDGGNDVSMIMEANIGVGIHGEEGMSAVQASDFSIGEFKLLKRLLFVHGRINLYRISKMILYFFFKNFVFTMTQFYFAFFCLASGQTFVDDWYITCYNLIFTALPLCVSALTDSDINLNDNKVAKKNLALLYRDSRDAYRIFSFGRFIWTLFKGILYSLIIFVESCVKQMLVKKGYYSNIWFLSLKSYICVLSVVSSNLLINSGFIVIYLPISIAITTFLAFFGFLVINHYGLLFDFNSKASIISSLTSPILYFALFLILSLSIIIDYSFKLLNLLHNNNYTLRIILKNSIRRKKKNSLILLNGISSKSISNHKNGFSKSNSHSHSNKKDKKKNKVRSSCNNPDISKNKLIMKTSHFIINNLHKNYSFKQNNFTNETNNVFTLKFKGANKIKY